MTSGQHSGAKWWKVDFHAHSPASFDYGGLEGSQTIEPKPSYEDWLLAYMMAEIDCIIITDHNSHAGIDAARDALNALRADNPDHFREIVLLPGVEITTAGGYHLLGAFEVNTPSDLINGILHKCEYSGSRGGSDATTTASFREVVDFINDASGLPIPAHADGTAGLYAVDPRDLTGIVETQAIVAAEHINIDATATTSRGWIPVLGSDAHHLNSANTASIPDPKYPGSHFTWVKMGQPTLAGIRVALSDGTSSIKRSNEFGDDPNVFGHSTIESIHIESQGETFNYSLSPWLNTIIGGRGTGKSTVIEYARLALQRFSELPKRVQSDLEWFSPYTNHRESRAWDSSTKVEVTFRRLGETFRVSWRGEMPLRSEIDVLVDGEWVLQTGDVRERFPVLINSQKQIYEMASDPQSLLGLIDQQPDIDMATWQQNHDAVVLEYKTQRAEIEEVENRISEEDRLRGNLSDADSLIAKFATLRDSPEVRELDGLRVVLRATDKAEIAATRLEGTLEEAISLYRRDALPPVYAGEWDVELERLAAVRRAESLIDESLDILQTSRAKLDEEATPRDPRALRLEELEEHLKPILDATAEPVESVGPHSLDPYGAAIHRREGIRDDLLRIESDKIRLPTLKRTADATLGRVRASRETLTRRRVAAANTMISSDFKLKIFPQANQTSIENDLRHLTQRPNAFDSIFGPEGLATLLMNPYSPRYVESVDRLKEALKDLHANGRGGKIWDTYTGASLDLRFVQQLQSIDHREFSTAVDVWFPEDRLQVLYKQDGEANLKPLDEGSPGQKTAALLALILQLGTEPLIMDQPEDDLDNRLIYDLIVTTLKRVKTRRQVIVVTHNANVVVNADAEQVAVLEHGKVPRLVQCGAIQDETIRAAICSIMEGGETAFAVRYKRLMPHA